MLALRRSISTSSSGGLKGAAAAATAAARAPQTSALQFALSLEQPSHEWSKEQLREIYHTPLLELVHSAQLQHRRWHDPTKVQLCTLMNIKSGGCSEDCKYCAQSSRYSTGVKAEKLVSVDAVLKEAEEAKQNGSTRFCLGAAWRDMNGRKSGLRKISEMVTKVNEMGLETCVTLGMVNEDQAKQLKDAGLTAYNHNIDTSREHYPKVITSRSYDDRLNTIKNVQSAGIKACTGGILGLGETEEDHIGFVHTLANMTPHPESLPINRLVAIKGTPMEEDLQKKGAKKLQFDEILRTVATARLTMPRAIIRLAAGRYTMKETEQFLCFLAGCNAIFTGKKMLTTMCNGWDEDKAMLSKWGLEPMQSFDYDAEKRSASAVDSA
ncbi:biotin synthase [Lachancea thermotolerans CBS 6340]|uniref:biotin synthase n=1 Tax=Lachancea thermotolerans (strain ATCC 56472 / CBS 6340 / NRRL Y-8284) TaxID=559295 RepID=C5DKK4_LACTC|nr:KLTH0F05456p [Lachancea thermotolerans CBS 6340]CAR24005.1 KLTH0F05456p [Lachancea thermotolerans CBS 6340]